VLGKSLEDGEGSKNADQDSVSQIGPEYSDEIGDVEDGNDWKARHRENVSALRLGRSELPDNFQVLEEGKKKCISILGATTSRAQPPAEKHLGRLSPNAAAFTGGRLSKHKRCCRNHECQARKQPD